jgi:hypothetical protein
MHQKLYDFTVFSLCFSLCHAAVMACVAYSSSEFSDVVSTISNGSLYLCNAFAAFFIAGDFVYYAGPKFSMFIGLIGNCIFVLGFLISALRPSTVWFIFIPSSIVGGLASGLQWTAQGKYYAVASIYYSEEINVGVEDSNKKFAAIFATTYLLMEVLFKMTATGLLVLFPGKGKFVVFTIYTIFAAIATFLISGVSDLNMPFSKDLFRELTIQKSIQSCVNFISTDEVFQYLAFFQFGTGVALSYVTAYVYGTIVGDSDSLGDSYIGILSALVVVIAALVSMTSTVFVQFFGKSLHILLANLSICFLGIILLFVSDSQLGTWTCILPYLILEGLALGIWESTNKAIVADIYGSDEVKSSSAFAMLYFLFFLGNGIGYFCINLISREVIVFILIVCGVLGMVPYIYLLSRFSKEDRRRNLSSALERVSTELKFSSGRHDSRTLSSSCQSPLIADDDQRRPTIDSTYYSNQS